MRIIAGTHRGRPIAAPKGDGTRPILDRQKEALFNVLRQFLPCGGALDVFAGSGGLGFEALSRGAERATFVERARDAVATLRRNVSDLGFDDRAHVIVRDAFAIDPERLHPIGVAFFDPPFPLYRDRADAVHGLIVRVVAASTFEADGVVMLRVPRGADVPPFAASLDAFDRRDSGESVIILLRPAV
ncbi:MAG: hypothetical protein CMJ83_19830 [Planctomycetes bacterium]|nr:hypothetical protein [Planctomycetota bacterium]